MEARSTYTYDYTAAVIAVKNGDMDAFEALYNESIPAFRRQVMKYLKNEADAEDVLQEVYIRIFNSINTLEDPSSFLSWGLKICTNLSINRIRSMHGKKNDFDLMPNTSDEDTMGLEDIPAESYRAEFNPEASMDEKETARLMREIVDDLPEIQRLCIMGWQEKITAKELARELGISENSVYVSINQGKKKIKAKVLELEKQGTKLYGMAPLTFFLWIMDIYDASFVPAQPAFAGISSFTEIAARLRDSLSAPQGTGGAGTGHGITSQISQQGEAGTGTGHISQGQGAGNPSSSATGGNNMDMQGTHIGISSASSSSSSGFAAAGKEQAAAKAAAGAAKGEAAKGTAGVISKVVVTRIVAAVVIVSVVIGGITVFRRVTKTTKEETVTETTTTTSESHDEDTKIDDPAEFLKGLGLEYIGNQSVKSTGIAPNGSDYEKINADPIPSGCIGYKEINLDNDNESELLVVNAYVPSDRDEDPFRDPYNIVISIYEKNDTGWVLSSESSNDALYVPLCVLDYLPSTRLDVFVRNKTIYIECSQYEEYMHSYPWTLSGYEYDGKNITEIALANEEDSNFESGIRKYITLFTVDAFSFQLTQEEIGKYVNTVNDRNINKDTLREDLLYETNLLKQLNFNIQRVGSGAQDAIIAQDNSLIPICRIICYEFTREFTVHYIDFNITPLSDVTDVPANTSDNINDVSNTVGTLETMIDNDDYILSDSNRKYVNESEILALSKDELRLARNEIYARHGRMFNSEDLQAYFDAKDWYNGTISPEEFDAQQDTILNEYEKKNIELIQRYEQ